MFIIALGYIFKELMRYWIFSVLSQIVVLRFVIDSVSLVAHIANIYTTLTRDRQNLLIFWMVLSFIKDILLEIVVIIITIILWRNGNITTSLLIEFIIKKAMRLGKWMTTALIQRRKQGDIYFLYYCLYIECRNNFSYYRNEKI